MSAGPPVVPADLTRIGLIAITVAVFTEVLRAAAPQFGHFATTSGGATATVVIPLVCLAGFLAPAIRALAGPRGLLVAGIGGLLLSRLATQALSPALWLAFVGTALGMLAVTALYETGRGMSGTGFAVAALGGLTAETALRLAFGTWDPASRTGLLPWLACLVLVAGGAVALIRQLRTEPIAAPSIGWRDALGAAALGPFLALQILVLASPAFAASSGNLALPVAGAVVLFGQALSLAFLSSGLAVAAVPGGVCVFGGTILGVGAAAVTGRYGLTGVIVIVVVVAGQVLSAWLFAVACRAPLRRGGFRTNPDVANRAWRVDLGAALGGLLIVAVLLPFQVHYEAPLPLPNKALPGAAGILLGLLSAIAAARGGPLPARSGRRALGAGLVALLLIIVPGVAAATSPGTGKAGLAGTFRLVDYNIGDAVNGDGRLDPEAIARAVQAQHADVVALQEVGRGRLLSGTTDVGAWLARRLKMRLVWGPAADHQFGNAILSRLPVKATGTERLPLGAGPQGRSYVWARVDVGGGRSADVWSVQLQDHADRAQTRQSEVSSLLRAWSGAPHTVIAGDLNARPGAAELARLSTADDLRDVFGQPDGTRTDRMFGTDDLGFTETSASGLLATTIRVI